MLELQKIDEAFGRFLKSNNISICDSLLVFRSDLGIDMHSRDVWVIFSPEEIIIAEGVESIEKNHGISRNGKYFSSSFCSTRFERLSVSSIRTVQFEEQISSGYVSAEMTDGSDILLFNTSMTYKHEALTFCRCFDDFKQNGQIDEEKYKDSLESERNCPVCGRRYPDPSRKICPKCINKTKLIKKLSGFFFKYKWYIALVFLTFLMISGLGVITPYVSNKVMYDDVLKSGGKYYGEILLMIGVIVAVKLVSTVVNAVNGIINAKVAARVVYDLKTVIFNSISRLNLSFFTSRQTGGLMTQINSDANTIYSFFCDGFPYLIIYSVQLVSVIVIMFLTNVYLTLYTFITLPLFFISYKIVFSLFLKLHAKSFSKRRSMNSMVSDVLTGARVVKSFSREDQEIKRFGHYNHSFAESETELGTSQSKIFPILNFLLKTGTFIVWGIGGTQIMNGTGDLSYGTLMTFIAYISLVNEPIRFLAEVSDWWASSTNAMQRLFEISDSVSAIFEKENCIKLESLKGSVKFDNVSFEYVEGKKTIDSVSFDIAPGSSLGIVGHTGAGKSTIANLLIRLYDVKEGSISIDGIDVRDLSFDTLRKNIAIVSQETYLFRGTILDNIRYAKPDATYEEVINAAKAASAHSFIMKYPEAYHTQIGMGLRDLSGGEKQRISIARAILLDPKILILDEATAAMDTQTERQIQSALDRLTENRTTIIIAHRLSTLRNADELVVIERGKLVEKGTAKELMKNKGIYFNLYKKQMDALRNVGINEE